MKKLVVLALLLAAGMLWAQAAAAPAYPQTTIAAKVEYMSVYDFSDGKEYSDKPIIEFKWTIKTDDFNTLYIELDGNSTDDLNTDVAASLGKKIEQPFDRAWFTSDLGKALKLPVGVLAKVGFEEWKNKDGIKVTKTEWEDILSKAFKKWGGQVEIMPSPMFTIRSNWSWNPDEDLAGGVKQYFMAGAYGASGPVAFEAAYNTNGKGEMALGVIEGGVKFAQDVSPDLNVGVAVSGDYDMDDEANVAAYWRAAVGANVLFKKMASLGLAWRGQSDPADVSDFETGALQVNAWAMPVAGQPLELMAQVGIGLAEDKYPETFDSFEVALKYSIGKAYFYLGLLFNAELGQYVAKEWADLDVSPTTGANSTTGLIFRGGISF